VEIRSWLNVFQISLFNSSLWTGREQGGHCMVSKIKNQKSKIKNQNSKFKTKEKEPTVVLS
jgi:hypothetical protein